MSHELYFYVNAEDKPVKKGLFGPLKADSGEDVLRDELLAFLQATGHFTVISSKESDFEGHYFNRHTGTEIAFRLRAGTIHDVECRYSFPGFNYTGLSVAIEYFRPAYFAHEAAPVIEAMCKKLRMYVLDPQLSPLLKKCIANTIVRSWELGNEHAVLEALGNREGQDPAAAPEGRMARPYMPRNQSMAWWKYMSRKEELRVRIRSKPDGVFVPEWKIIRRVGGKKLLLAMTLTEGIGYIMPQCDVFLIKRNRLKEVGAVDASELLPRIKDYLRPWTFSGIEFNVLTSPNARRIAPILRETKLESIREFEQIAPGSIFDVEVDTEETE